jgi:hypothetical protein
MTMPEEQATVVVRTRKFLLKISHSRDDFISEEIRLRARALLSHFPDDDDVAMLCSSLPDWWQLAARRGKNDGCNRFSHFRRNEHAYAVPFNVTG